MSSSKTFGKYSYVHVDARAWPFTLKMNNVQVAHGKKCNNDYNNNDHHHYYHNDADDDDDNNNIDCNLYSSKGASYY